MRARKAKCILEAVVLVQRKLVYGVILGDLDGMRMV
jgi:hypothetical protein